MYVFTQVLYLHTALWYFAYLLLILQFVDKQRKTHFMFQYMQYISR